MELLLNWKDEQGANCRLDSAKQAVSFNIINEPGAEDSSWEHNVFGHTMYRKFQILSAI